MQIPFTITQFLEVFKTYNHDVYPMQFVLYLLGAMVVYSAWKPNINSDKPITIILAALWFWMGIVYHIGYFSAINKIAYFFGICFMLQGMLLLFFGLSKLSYEFRFVGDVYGIIGSAMIAFALLGYPLIGYFLGRVYPASPTFGVPCPTTIFTFGVLLLNQKKCPIGLLVIPTAWSLVGFIATFQLGILEDSSIIIASSLAVLLLVYRNQTLPNQVQLDFYSAT